MTKKQNKKSQQLERRAKEKERLLAIYKEGESNIDHEKLKDKSWEEVFELMEAGTIPIKTKEQWLKEELDKWEENQIEVPSYKVQDPQAQLVKFQQRFVDEAKNVKPEAFEKLRAFAPSFQYLFTKETGKDFTMQLYELRETLISHVLSSAYWQPNEKITPDNVWRVFLKPTFVLARTMTHIDTPALNIEYDDMVKSQIEFHRYSLENFNQQIAYQFKDSAYDEDKILIHFFHLQTGIFDWIEKYNLKYDWLIDYAYYFLFHFNRTPEIAAKDIPVWPRNYSSPTLYKTFKFEAAGWWASEEGENADDYRERVTNEFEKALDEYIVAGTLFMGLEHKTKFTKPTSMKTVPWLVRRVFFGWSAEQIVEHFFPEIDRTRSKLAARSFISKRKYVEDEMRELKKYKLPVL